jgi:hypothetical protein
VSHLDLSSTVWVRFSPIRGEMRTAKLRIPMAFDVGGGTGVVHTVDDLFTLQAEGDPLAESTAKQVHPAIGLTGGVRVGGHFGVRIQGTWLHYIEVIAGDTLESKSPASLEIGVWWSPPRTGG